MRSIIPCFAEERYNGTTMHIDPKELGVSADAANNFFRYVNGSWIEKNEIPANESLWGSFSILRVQVEEQLKKIFDDFDKPVADSVPLDANTQKVKDFYASGMDVEKLNALRDRPLAELFAAVEGITTLDDLANVVGKLHRCGVNVLWSSAAWPDAKKSDVMALYIGQGGLGLPDRDYYLKSDEASLAIQKKYADYATGIISKTSLVAAREPATVVHTIIEIEKTLAEASMTRVELRDVERQYNKMTQVELAKLAPQVNWDAYYTAAGIATPEYVIVCQPKFFEAVGKQFETTPLESLKSYMRWHIVNDLANFLSEDFATMSFDFYGRTFGGATEMKPRWRRVLNVVNTMLDEAVGQIYVKNHFSESAKERIKNLVEHLTTAYKTRIERLAWMSVETKEKALAKLAAVKRKLGYPDRWKDIDALLITRDAYAENYMRGHAFEFDRQMKKIGKPVDPFEWYMSPQTVNACYEPLRNEILFPAAILQPPFFYPDGDDGVNFGGIGTVIGHELTHGFDDQGALFDPHGNLLNWWTKEDKERFDREAERLAGQFDRYEPLPGLHVNGKLTLGENIADLGGLLIAYDGLTLAMKERQTGPIDGLTAYERFFINYAITERSKSREEYLRLQVHVDPHSPSEYRVNGPLSNMTEFYEAFHVKAHDALWREPDDRVKIW